MGFGFEDSFTIEDLRFRGEGMKSWASGHRIVEHI